MGFESLDGSFLRIAPVHMRGHQLVRCIPLFIDRYAVLCVGFVVQDLLVNFVAALFDSPADVVVCDKMVVVTFGV